MSKGKAKTIRMLENMGVGQDSLEENKTSNYISSSKRKKEFLSSLPNAGALSLQDWNKVPELWALQNVESVNKDDRYQNEQEKIETNKKEWCDEWISLYDAYRAFPDKHLSIWRFINLLSESSDIYVLPYVNNSEIKKIKNINATTDIYIAKSQLYKIMESEKQTRQAKEDVIRRIGMMKDFYSIGEISFNLKIPIDTVVNIINSSAA